MTDAATRPLALVTGASRGIGAATATALVGANDMIAIGVISVLREKGLRVPEDYSVCGFDNIFTSSIITPPLTSIDHRLWARCRSAVTRTPKPSRNSAVAPEIA